MKPDFEVQNLTRNCNEALILAILNRGPRHGYQLALEIETESAGFFRLNHGTLYPILHKLEKERLIKGVWSDEGPKRKRKQYTLTAQGAEYLAGQKALWKGFMDRFSQITGG